MTLRILLADDHAMFRSGLRAVLDTQPDFECVAEVVDVRMPKLDGLAAAEAILAEGHVGTRVLVLTTFDIDEYVYRALAAGASGFLLKSLPPEELVAAIRIAARGDALIDPSVTHRLVARFAAGIAPSNTPAVRAPGLDRLTTRENEVLLLVAAGYSNVEIGARLYIGDETVKTHVSRILAKLDLRDRVQAVVYAHRHGLLTTSGEGEFGSSSKG
jgi:DNA-binding NarL/FixJ family response regulator